MEVADVEEVKRFITQQKCIPNKPFVRKVCPKEIPANVTIEEILKSLPKEVV
jgi:hypothetical protein